MRSIESRNRNRILAWFILALLLVKPFALTAFANSAEPPCLTVIVSFPPDGLTLSLRFADGSVTNAIQLQKEQKAWEAYYRFFYSMVAAPASQSLKGATLVVDSNEKSFECLLPESAFAGYNNLLTLNVTDERVAADRLLVRSFLLIAMRVVLTLLIEGIVFFAFGYRNKASWKLFVAVNLLTQSLLNILLSGPNLSSYWIFGFVFYEIVIFIAETTGFALKLREYKKGRAVAYALTANISSLILGGILISCLPV